MQPLIKKRTLWEHGWHRERAATGCSWSGDEADGRVTRSLFFSLPPSASPFHFLIFPGLFAFFLVLPPACGERVAFLTAGPPGERGMASIASKCGQDICKYSAPHLQHRRWRRPGFPSHPPLCGCRCCIRGEDSREGKDGGVGKLKSLIGCVIDR